MKDYIYQAKIIGISRDRTKRVQTVIIVIANKTMNYTAVKELTKKRYQRLIDTCKDHEEFHGWTFECTSLLKINASGIMEL